MFKKRRDYYWYRMAVLAYYRCEWTNIDDQDRDYKIKLTTELDQLIENSYKNRMNVPNASKQIELYLTLLKEQW
jgi:hypothetical protein